MKYLEEIKNWLVKRYYYVYLDIIGFGMVKYSYLPLYKNKVLFDYINETALKLADNEGIRIFNLSFDEINKDEKVEKEKAVGVFRYLKGDALVKYQELLSEYEKLNTKVPIEHIYPRIEISDKGDVFTILHELGHFFIYKENKVQSEEGANLFIEEFFTNHLPPFFKWIYQIEIQCRKKDNKKLEFTTLECHKYLKQYNEFCKKHNNGN